MVASYSDKLRLTKQGTNDNPNTWGVVLNEQVIDLIGEAIAGVTQVSITGSSDVTLTTNNGSEDQARNAVLELTGALGANINVIIPSVEKVYFIRGAWTGSSYEVSIKISGSSSSVTLKTGDKRIIYSNGTDVFDMVDTGVHVTDNDTNPSTLNNKMTATPPLTKTLNNAGADETLSLGFDTNFITSSVGLQSGQNFYPGSAFSTDITLPIGGYTSSDGTFMSVTSSVTKGIDAVWEEGTGKGGLDAGTVTNDATYYVFAIYNPTTGITDGLFSISKTSPVMPTGYTKKRLLGFVRTDSSSLLNSWNVVWTSFGPADAPTAWLINETDSANAIKECYYVFDTDPAKIGSKVAFTKTGDIKADGDVTAFASS